jgi:hypothetical protein
MNDTKFGDVTRPLWTIRRHGYIPTGSSQLDQGSKRAGATTRTRASNRLMAESSDDPRNNFPIAMSADEHMRTGSSVADQDH